jgi:hypothetical protein
VGLSSTSSQPTIVERFVCRVAYERRISMS